MIESANKYTISNIFDIERDVKYIIPKYQRHYAWRKQHWEDLFNDLIENDIGHFLGSIICVSRSTDSLSTTELEIIDGQQRLTTISLLYAVIYELLDEIKDPNDELRNELINLKYRLIQKSDKNQTKLFLSSEGHNFHDFRCILADLEIFDFEEEIGNVGNRRLSKAYNFLYNKIKTQLVFDDEDVTIKNVLELLKKVNGTLLVKIEVNSISDAYTLFESLNNRGVPLTAIDLIKNKLLSELEKKDIIKINEAFLKWKKIISNIEDYIIQERFLRHYYNAFKYNQNINVDGFSRATRSNLIKIYEILIERDPQYVLNELREKSDIYKKFVDEEQKFPSEYSLEFIDLLRVGAAPSYQFLMYLFTRVQNNKEIKLKTLSFLIKYFVRRNLTDFPNTRDLDKIFIELIKKCETEREITFELLLKYLTHPDRFSTLEQFKKSLRGDIYEENVGITRFLLARIENKHNQTRERFIDVWKRDEKNKFIWTIEHIYPQGDNISKHWVEMIANGNREKAEEYQEKYVHKIGNLTLTGYNPNLSDLPFKEKKERKNKDKKPIGFNNELYLNEDIINKDKWTINDIQERTDKLVSQIIEISKIENE